MIGYPPLQVISFENIVHHFLLVSFGFGVDGGETKTGNHNVRELSRTLCEAEPTPRLCQFCSVSP